MHSQLHIRSIPNIDEGMAIISLAAYHTPMPHSSSALRSAKAILLSLERFPFTEQADLCTSADYAPI